MIQIIIANFPLWEIMKRDCPSPRSAVEPVLLCFDGFFAYLWLQFIKFFFIFFQSIDEMLLKCNNTYTDKNLIAKPSGIFGKTSCCFCRKTDKNMGILYAALLFRFTEQGGRNAPVAQISASSMPLCIQETTQKWL